MTSAQVLKRLIVLEGLDGSGTTTQQARALKYVAQKYKQYTWHGTAEPQQRSTAVVPLREYLGQNPLELAGEREQSQFFSLLFCADRVHHLCGATLQATKLDSLYWTICDRYVLSTLAYQAYGLGPDHQNWVENLLRIFPHPGLTIYLRVRPHICLKRIRQRKAKTEIYETTETLTRVSDGYEAYLRWYDGAARGDVGRVVVVDGEGSQTVVWKRVKEEIDSYLNLFGQGELPFDSK